MNTNGEPSCICQEEGRKVSRGTEWTEFRFDLACPFHFPHSTLTKEGMGHELTDTNRDR